MIRVIEALNYKCLRYLRTELGRFEILVGPNSGGKSTFLDVPRFLRDLVSGGPERAVDERGSDFRELLWAGSGDRLELAVELEIPQEKRALLARPEFDRVRYEVQLGLPDPESRVELVSEAVVLKETPAPGRSRGKRLLFPRESSQPRTILTGKGKSRTRQVVSKIHGGNDNFYRETEGKGRQSSFKLGPAMSALGNLPEDETLFPVATWLKRFLLSGLTPLALHSEAIRRPSPRPRDGAYETDGSSLPWMIHDLFTRSSERFGRWIKHLRTALPDLEAVETIERPEDRRRYLIFRYRGGFAVPSWLLSDGALRLTALAILAYLPLKERVWVIEEPENGIHPSAVQTVFDTLSSVYDGQVLMATHSPVILSLARADRVLCFGRTPSGEIDVIRGTEHPGLREWHGEENLGVLYASGVLG